MKKEQWHKDDGRYIIFYTFADELEDTDETEDEEKEEDK